MIDPETFLPTLYVMVDECCQTSLPPAVPPGPRASFSRREVVTRGLLGPWACFRGERAFYRYPPQHLCAAVPSLPHRTPRNRLLRRHHEAMVACFLHLVDLLAGRHGLYEALESSAGTTREAKRRGTGGLPGLADIGWSNRLDGYAGFQLLMAVHPRGVMTGCGVGPASATDQPLAEPFFALRRQPHPRCLSVGKPALGPYVCEKGFEGQAAHARWWSCDGAQVICPPQRHSRHPWATHVRRWLAGVRQSVETVDDQGHHPCGLTRERPHALTGFQARLATQMTRHTFCL